MEYIALPFEEEWTADEKATALKVFVCNLVNRSKAQWKDAGFSQELLTNILSRRFKPALGRPDPERLNHYQKLFSFLKPEHEARMIEIFNSKAATESLLKKLEEIAVVSIREQALGAYIETAVHLLLGVEEVYPFISLLNC